MTAPRPFTPVGCDLRDFPRIMIDIPRLFASGFNGTASRSPLAWMIGHKLWYRSWHQVPAGSLPDDDDELCHLAELGFDTKSFAKAKALAMRGWIKCSDGRLYHPVVCEAALESWQEKLRQRLSSGNGNGKRWGVAFDPIPVASDLTDLIACLERLNPQSKSIMKARKTLGGIKSDILVGLDHDPSGIEIASQCDNGTPGILSQGIGTGTGILEEESFALPGSAPPKPVPAISADQVREAFDLWNALARRAGLPTARDFTDDRRKRIGVRLRAVGLDGWRSVLATVEASDFCRGSGERGWRIALDDLFQTKTWNKLRDGGYGAVVVPGADEIKPEVWARLLANWRNGEPWPETAGPPPDKPGTRVPSHLLIRPVAANGDEPQRGAA